MYLRICWRVWARSPEFHKFWSVPFRADYQMMPFAANLLEHTTDFDARADAHIAAQPRTRTKRQRTSFYRAYTKRVLDIFFILLSLPVVLPIIAIGALLIMRDGHSPTDQNAKAEWDATQKLKNDPRITTIGRILRKSSVDELRPVAGV